MLILKQLMSEIAAAGEETLFAQLIGNGAIRHTQERKRHETESEGSASESRKIDEAIT